ncbi:hypothetical protein GCM10020366_71750 [Saccharopolyspora gregorii]|uniref:Uncharacterized protein n=2 Tax=Saccharopolyspora gregorii TaxID=33914 RepID=A0ABP6S328_9PSEU
MVDALNESAAQHSRSGREPEPRTELLGPDVFGRRAARTGPPTSSPGTTTPNLPADRIISMFRSLDMARPQGRPTHAEMAPDALIADPRSVTARTGRRGAAAARWRRDLRCRCRRRWRCRG